MKNKIINLCRVYIDRAKDGDIFVSSKSSDTFFLSTIKNNNNIVSVSHSNEHGSSISVNDINQDITEKEFKSLKNLILDKFNVKYTFKSDESGESESLENRIDDLIKELK